MGHPPVDGVGKLLTYYITNRTQFAGTEAERRTHLLRTIGWAAAAGVDFIQLREKDLCIRDLESLAREALQVMRGEGLSRLLINHRTDVALAVGADGVHLRGSDIAASDARALAAGRHTGQFLVAASCHSAQEVRLAEAHGADFAVLAPIFEKVDQEKVNQEKVDQEKVSQEKADPEKGNPMPTAIGLDELRRAAQHPQASDARVEAGERRRTMPVFALGGVDLERAPLCAAAGASGIAGIRIFQQSRDLPALVRALRSL
jgi:thiamine-phosphate pyrophosphorylase